MNRTRVKSSNIRSVGYDPNSNILEVEFSHGGIYQYINVPESIFREFLTTPSKGKFHSKNIKGHYSFRKIK